MNFRAYVDGTGVEIFFEIGVEFDVFVCVCGIGGMFVGVGVVLKEWKLFVKFFFVDS